MLCTAHPPRNLEEILTYAQGDCSNDLVYIFKCFDALIVVALGSDLLILNRISKCSSAIQMCFKHQSCVLP